MPINQPNISIHPLDLNANVAIGVVFPLMDEGVFKQSLTIKEQVKSNLLMVLLTDKGERVFMTIFGVGLIKLIFENHIDTEELKDKINNQVNFYVPEIEIQDLLINLDKDEHVLQITLSYVLLNSNELDAIEINVCGSNLADGIDITTRSAQGGV